MRSWDNWNRYQDNNGNPLHGCVMFNVKDGNTVAPIYDRDGTPLDNPILTDIYGRTIHQVFVDTDVTAYFYLYIGEGSYSTQLDIDVNDDTKWALQFTTDNIDDVLLHISTDTTLGVGTLQELRALDPDTVGSIAGKKIITLLGYNATGDKEPVNYVWEPESEEYDDGGSVIKPDDLLTGRWIMVLPTEHCDSRHFGVFPSVSSNMQAQNYGMTKLFAYCNSNGIRPFFDRSTSRGIYYKYDTLNVICNYGMDVSDNVYFIDSGNSTINLGSSRMNGNPYFMNASTTVTAYNASTKWHANAYNGYTEFAVDSAMNDMSVSNAHVTGKGAITNTSFSNCTFDINGTIGNGCSFSNCVLVETMFNGAPTVSTVTNCTASILDFRHSVAMWIQLQHAMGISELDFQSTAVPEGIYLDYTGADKDYEIRNAIFSSSQAARLHCLGGAHTYNFVNCQGPITFEGNVSGRTYMFRNCKGITPVWNSSGTNRTVTIIDSEVNFRQPLNNTILSGKNSIISIYNLKEAHFVNCTVSGSASPMSFTSYSCILTCTITSPQMVVKDSQINSNLTSIEHFEFTNAYIDAYMDNNIFNAQHIVYSNTANTIFRGGWIHNTGSVSQPINITRTNLKSADSSHLYEYSDNSGTFLPGDRETAKLAYTLTMGDQAQNQANDGYVGCGKPEGSVDIQNSCVFFLYYAMPEGQEYPDHGIPGVQLFRVGTDQFSAKVDWTIYGGTAWGSVPMEFLVAPISFNMVMKNTGNNTYRACVRSVPFQMDGNNYWTIPIGHFRRNPSDLTGSTLQGTFWFTKA